MYHCSARRLTHERLACIMPLSVSDLFKEQVDDGVVRFCVHVFEAGHVATASR